MKILTTILGMLALLVISAQLFRHVYVRWIEPRTSLLDRFEQATEQQIDQSKTVGELLALYKVQSRLVDADKAKYREEEDESEWERQQREPYHSEQVLRNAIEERERHHAELLALHFFWWCGAGCVLLGSVAQFVGGRWLALTAMVLGILEMIWATCPSFVANWSAVEFDRLLTFKVIYSALSIALLLVLWRIVACALSRNDNSPREAGSRQLLRDSST